MINRQIDYSFLNKYFDNSKFKFHLDTVRLRITHEYGLPCIFDKINAKYDICDYYLNADFETIENMEKIFFISDNNATHKAYQSLINKLIELEIEYVECDN